MNPQPFAAFSEDDADGRAHLEAAEDFKYPDDEAEPTAPESMKAFMERIHWRLVPNGKRKSVKRVGMHAIVFLWHIGAYENKSLKTLAREFGVSDWGLYKLSHRLYGDAGIEKRKGRENMRRARLRCLKEKPLSSGQTTEASKIEGAANPLTDAGGANEGGVK